MKKLFKSKLALIVIAPLVSILGLGCVVTSGTLFGLCLIAFLVVGLFAWANALSHYLNDDIEIK